MKVTIKTELNFEKIIDYVTLRTILTSLLVVTSHRGMWFVLNDYIWPIVQSGVPTRVKVRISGLSEIRIYPDHFCNRKPMPQIRIPEFSFFGGMNTILEHFFVTKYSNMGLILKVIASWFETWCQNNKLSWSYILTYKTSKIVK